MAKRNRQFDEAKVQRYFAEGRGQGSGKDYRPWLKIHDVPSLGRVHRVVGMTTGRIHHLMSDGEWRYFIQCDWDDEVTDIREQFPLDRMETLKIANKLGIKHPATTDGTPYPLTTDFLLVLGKNETRRLTARTYKMKDDDLDERTREKLEIERRYWKTKGVDWAMVNETNVNHVLVRNVESLYGFHDLTGLSAPEPWSFQQLAREFCERFGADDAPTLGDLCRSIDADFGLSNDETFVVARHLLARKMLLTDMSDPTPFALRSLAGLSLTLPSESVNGAAE
ncbi:MAG: TnsA endonuclease N-terminal domain-containing protein [Pseudomonadota bacterium]